VRLSIKNFWMQRVLFWPLTALLISAALLQCGALPAEQVPVRHVEGTVRGFLVLRDAEGKTFAAGDLIQIIKGDRLVANLVFHFKDGSVDEETTVFSQRHDFRLISDHHVQKGPTFPHPMDVLIDASTGQVTVHSTDHGKDKIVTDHLDLQPDLANGLLFTLLKNIQPDVTETKVSYVAATPKPRLVKLSIKPEREDAFRTAGDLHKAINYDVKIELGGVAGVVAPLIGKQPKDIHIWILGGKAPTFVRMEGQLYEGGPVWTVELTSPVWQESQHSSR
jgi:hypothetical protein